MGSRSVTRADEDRGRRLRFDTRAMERSKSLYVTEFAGGEEAAKRAMSLSPDPQIQKFLRALTSRAKAKRSIYGIASYYGITVSQLVEVLRTGYYDGTLNELFRAGQETAKAAIRDAQPSQLPCPRCDGRKTVLFPRILGMADASGNRPVLEEEKVTKCPGCQGKGTVRSAGSTKAQEMIFRATKVLEEKGLQINLQQNSFSGVDSLIDEMDSRHPKRRKAIPEAQQTIEVKGERDDSR